MKIIRFSLPKNNSDSYGVIESDRIYSLHGDPFSGKFNIDKSQSIPFDPVRLLVPCLPTKVVALAINYHGVTGHKASMKEPLIFLKSSNAVVGSNQKVKLIFNTNTWGESELGLVIRKTTKPQISLSNINEYIFGYIPVNDVSCGNVDDRDHHLARSKSADAFCPLGQYIDTEYNFRNKKILSYHNDILLRKGNTSQMIWDPEKIVAWLAGWMTLYPGDLVITGAPSRVRDRLYLKDGDTFTVKIEGFSDLVTKFYV